MRIAMKKAFLSVVALFLFESCSLLGIKPSLKIEIAETGSAGSRAARSRSLADQSEELDGVHIGHLAITAYEETKPNEFRSFYVTSNVNYYDTADLFLKPAETIDLTALSVPDNPNTATFRMDFLCVEAQGMGVVLDRVFYGCPLPMLPPSSPMDTLTTHPLYKYPEYDGIPTYSKSIRLEGLERAENETVNSAQINILYARNDWFPEPMLVKTNGWNYAQPDGHDDTVDWASKPISEQQWIWLKRAIQQGGFFAIIPYGEVKTLNIANIFASESLRIEVNFDTLLSDVSYMDWRDDGLFEGTDIYLKVVDQVPMNAKLVIGE